MEGGDDVSAAILKVLKFSPRGLSITDISKKLKRNRNVIARQLDVLKAEGKVETRQIGAARVYWLSQRVPLSAFLCFTQNMILILDRRMNIVQANDKFIGLTGYSKDELIGKNLHEITLPILSGPEILGIIESTGKEQVITDIRARIENNELFYRMEVIPTSFEAGEPGLTIILEDITEKKRHLKNIEFLARTAMELVDLPAEADIYQYVAERMTELLPENPRCWVESYDEVKGVFFVQAQENRLFREKTIQVIGRDLVGMAFPLDSVYSDAPFFETHSTIKTMREYHFHPFFDDEEVSFYDLSAHQFPKDSCETILRTLNIGKIFSTGLVWQEQVFGIVGIGLGPDEVLENKQAIESFFRQASIAIARRMTEERLLRSEQRFQDMITHCDCPAAVIDPVGNIKFINQQFTKEFGYTQEDIPNREVWFEKAFPNPILRQEAIAAFDSDYSPSNRTFTMRYHSGEDKSVTFRPVHLSDGTMIIECKIRTLGNNG